jgi:SAM-dependent methyltransferase
VSAAIDSNRRAWNERALVHSRDATGAYRLDRIRVGEDTLHAIEAAELGDISRKRVLHLQCHIGTDSVCLARRGGMVTGLDFSQAALDAAGRLADETGLKIDFVCGTVDEAPRLAPGPFDLVYSTWGTICWLPDVRAWARVVAAVLKPGGELYFAEGHPGFLSLEEDAGKLAPMYDLDRAADRPLKFVEPTTYTGDTTVLLNQTTFEWIHSLSAVLTALIEAGFTILMFHEHDLLPWRAFPMLIAAGDGLWRLPEAHPRLPLSYSLRARRA